MPNFFGISRLMLTSASPPATQKLSRLRRHSYQDDSLHHGDRAQVAVPPLDRVLLDVAVPAEQLHAVAADLHAVLGGQPTREGGLARERQALLGARRSAQRDQPCPLQ